MTDLLPTTEEEQALLLNHWRNSPTISNIARRLIAEVKRLARQLGDELTADSVLCPHAPNHILEAKCKELEDRGVELSTPNQMWFNEAKIERLEAEVKRLREELYRTEQELAP